MKYSFPTVFSIDKQDKNYINVFFPDIPGAVTFGKDMTEARFMAKDVLIAMEEYLKITHSSNLETTKKNFPNDIVEIIEVDL